MSNKAVLGGAAVVVALMVIVGFYFLFPQQGVREVRVQLSDFIFILEDGSFPLEVKAGETVIFKVKNVGGFDHELMVVTAEMKDMMMNGAAQMLEQLKAQGLSGAELLEAYEEKLDEMEEQMDEGMLLMLLLEPGEELTGEVTFEEPGTYYIICLEAGGTADAGKTHAHQGMVAEIIVEG